METFVLGINFIFITITINYINLIKKTKIKLNIKYFKLKINHLLNTNNTNIINKSNKIKIMFIFCCFLFR